MKPPSELERRIAQQPLLSQGLYGEVNRAWRQGKPTGTPALIANRQLMQLMGADVEQLGEIGDPEELHRWLEVNRDVDRVLQGKAAHNVGPGAEADNQYRQETVLMWLACRLGSNPSAFRLSADFQRQLLATDHGRAVVSDLRLPLPAMPLELEPLIELQNRWTGLHPLQTIGVMEISHGGSRWLNWAAYCGAKLTSKDAFDDNYQCGVISLGDSSRPWTAFEAFEAMKRRAPEWAEFDNQREVGGAVDGEPHAVSEMLRNVVERLIVNAALYLAQDRPAVHRASNGKPVTPAELREAPKRTKVRVGRRPKAPKVRVRAYDLGRGEGVVRVAYKTLVRGHWRQQAHGPGRRLRKTLWIKPHVRHRGAPGAAAAHDYEN